MSATTTPRLPLVDDGRLSGVGALLHELRPRPGRLADTMRLVVLVLLAVTLAEVFRIPDPGVCAYVILFVSRGERASTVKTAVVAGVAVILAVFATIAVFMVSLSEPALRVCLIALVTFAAMALSRASKLGPAAFAAGFIIAYGLTIGDQVLGVALQSSEIGNTTELGLPELLFLPPEEALLHALLWLTVVVAMPVGLVVVGNLLTGRHPVELLRTALAARLAACADACGNGPGASAVLAANVRDGRAAMEPLLAGSGHAPGQPDYRLLIRESEQVAVGLLTWSLIPGAAADRTPLQSLAGPLRAAAAACVRDGITKEMPIPAPPRPADVASQPIAMEIARATTVICHALAPGAAVAAPPPVKPGALLSLDKLVSPDTVQFAAKVTLAVMLSYAAESLLDWPAIHTCVVTCFFVSLGTLGESLHKAALRIAGALIGGALGIGTILLLMPVMTDLGGLLTVLAAVTLLAGWVACGSERISYAGWQIGIAYYLTVLQGYGPTLDMQTARDRVIGILLGNIIVLAVFSMVWPVRLAQPVRRQVAAAMTKMAALARLGRSLPPDDPGSQPALQASFIAAIGSARALLANAAYEPVTAGRSGRRPIDAGVLAELEVVMLMVTVIHRLALDATRHEAPPAGHEAPWAGREAALAYNTALAAWLDDCAAWVQSGSGGPAIETSLPEPPRLGADLGPASQAIWYRLLDTRLRRIIGQVMHGADLSLAGVASHA